MSFRPPRVQPDFSDLITSLNNSRNQIKDNPLYQTIFLLLQRITISRDQVVKQIKDTDEITGNLLAFSYLTVNDDSAVLRNSRRELAGSGISFDDSVANVRTISSTGTFTKVTSTVTGTQNNLNIGIIGNTYCEWSGSSDATVTGITLGISGRLLIIKNTGSKVIYFSHNSGSSSAANRFQNIVTSSTTAVAPGGWIYFIHNGTDWRMTGHEQGDYITPAFAAGDFTLNGDRTWTVDSGDVTTYQWKLIGRSIHIIFVLETTTISGGTSSTTAKIAIPNGYISTKTVLSLSSYFILGATLSGGFISASASGTVINSVKIDQTDFGTGTNNMYFYGQFLFPVN